MGVRQPLYLCYFKKSKSYGRICVVSSIRQANIQITKHDAKEEHNICGQVFTIKLTDSTNMIVQTMGAFAT